MTTAQLENFELAFRDNGGSCRKQCECGREFFINEPDGWSWDEGEFESLLADPNATALEWCASGIWIEGTIYALDCQCWHPRAKRIINFIEAHAGAIAKWLSLEKHRKQTEADLAPTVKEP